MIALNYCDFIVIGTLAAILSNYIAVCEVDPSDMNSILMEQLKVQQEQLKVDKELLKTQNEQLRIQSEQLRLLDAINKRPIGEPPTVTILVSVSCTALGFVVLLFLKRVIKYLYLRYNLSPEMPQTAELELMDFAPYQQTDIERVRSVRNMKSPTDYFSCESDE